MENFWVKSYQEGVPHKINPDTFLSLTDFFNKSCKKFTDKIAYSNFGTDISYFEMDKYTKQFASFLQNNLKLISIF